ncbi:hypothetical protein ACQ4PT_033562 [Festuca glaucescens]
MGLCLGKTPRGGGTSSSSSSPCWADLPPEIAGVVLSRLGSHDDRRSFAGIRREWRLAAQHHRTLLPPAMPCINLGHGAYQSITDGKVRCFAKSSHGRVDASFGSWLLYEHEGSRRCSLLDPLSPSTPATEVPCRYGNNRLADRGCCHVLSDCGPLGREFPVEKILTLSPHLVVVMFQSSPFMIAPFNLAYFRPATPTEISWSPPTPTAGFIYKDIAFHRGKIFAVDWKGSLLAHELVVGVTVSLGPCEHVITVHLDDALAMNANYHLVTSCDSQKLLMVQWSIPNLMAGIKIDHHSMFLHIFEADLDKGQWSEVTDLGNQVLFVATTGSRAITVEGSSEHYHHRFQGGNRVFLLGNNWAWAWTHRRAVVAPCKCL